MPAKLLHFPEQEPHADLPTSLRDLADKIEDGHFGKVDLVAWTMTGDVSATGLIGETPRAIAEAYLLFGLAQKAMIGLLDDDDDS